MTPKALDKPMPVFSKLVREERSRAMMLKTTLKRPRRLEYRQGLAEDGDPLPQKSSLVNTQAYMLDHKRSIVSLDQTQRQRRDAGEGYEK